MIRLKIPATSANIGPGFDSLGFAVNVYNQFSISESDVLIIEGCPLDYQNANNLLYQTYVQTMEKLGKTAMPLNIQIDGNIPISRGLGSSSTLILAGVMVANILSKAKLTNEEILNLATDIEGHPDNLAPALYGGWTASFMDENKVYTQKIAKSIQLEYVALIPSFEFSTKKARDVLPKMLTYSDAIYNHSRVAYLMLALQNNDYQHLAKAISDRLHEPYRLPIIDKAQAMLNRALQIGAVATYLSGAGPTLMVLVENSTDFIYKFGSKTNGWQLLPLKVDENGAKCEVIM